MKINDELEVSTLLSPRIQVFGNKNNEKRFKGKQRRKNGRNKY